MEYLCSNLVCMQYMTVLWGGKSTSGCDFSGDSAVRNSPANSETWVGFLDWED